MNKRPILLVSLCYIFGVLTAKKNLICILLFSAVIFYLFFLYKKRAFFPALLLMLSFFTAVLLTGFAIGREERCISKIENNEISEASGRVYKKEIKNDNFIYYVKNKDFSFVVYPDENIYENPENAARIGDDITVTGSIKGMNKKRNEGNFDEENYYYSRGIYFKVFEGELTVNKRRLFSLKEVLFRLLILMQGVIFSYLPGEEGGILSAICLGSKAGLIPEASDLFRETGLSHILAVSGLHVSIVGMGLYSFLRKRRLSFLSSGMIAGMILILYGMLCGNSISAVRSVGMFIIYILSQILGEAYDSLNALSLMSLLILLFNPMYLFYSGFILSFLTVLFVLLFAKPLSDLYISYERLIWERSHRKDMGRKYRPRFKDNLISTFLFSFFIQLFSLPVFLYNFYGFSPYVILLNMLVLPFVGILLFFGLIGSLFGAFLKIGFLTKLLFMPCHVILYFYEFLMVNSLKLPLSRVYPGAPGALNTVFYYAVLSFITFFLLKKGGHHVLRSSIREEKTGRSEFYLSKREKKTLSLFIIIFFLLPFTLMIKPRESAYIKMLDVGQGDGILVSDGYGRHYMIDGGSTDIKNVGTYRIVPFLRYNGIKRIDAWFISHTDTDHISGLIDIIKEGYPVSKVYFSKDVDKNENYENLLGLLKENDISVLYLKEGDLIGRKECFFKVIFPGNESNFSGANENSLVLLLSTKNIYALFTGDIGEEQERYILSNSDMNAFLKDDEKMRILKAAHHGSDYSNSMGFLEELSPNLTIISAGINNRYGHPGKDAIARMEETGLWHLCTIDCGQITIEVEKGKVKRFLK